MVKKLSGYTLCPPAHIQIEKEISAPMIISFSGFDSCQWFAKGNVSFIHNNKGRFATNLIYLCICMPLKIFLVLFSFSYARIYDKNINSEFLHLIMFYC